MSATLGSGSKADKAVLTYARSTVNEERFILAQVLIKIIISLSHISITIMIKDWTPD